MINVLVFAAATCLSCRDAEPPTGLRLGVPDPVIDFQEAEGCVKFELTLVAGSAPTSQSVYTPNWPCPSGELRVLTDTAIVFDSTTGAMRVGVVLENVGTVPIIGPVNLSYRPNTIERYNEQGGWVQGLPDILAYQPDSSGAGDKAWWRFSDLLAAPGQPKVLMPGARTLRRWVEFRGTSWAYRTRLRVWALGKEHVVGDVPDIPPDSIPSYFLSEELLTSRPSLFEFEFVRDHLWVSFTNASTPAQRRAALEVVGGVIVGGWYKAPFGRFLIRLPTDTSHLSLFYAEAWLKAHPAVISASIEHVIGGVGVLQRPTDGLGWGRGDYVIDARAAYQPSQWRPTWHLSAISAPLAWGCSVGDAAVGVGVVDVALHTLGLSDLVKNVAGESRTNIAGSSDRHGTAVAMLLGAFGGDSTQMAGVAWRSASRLYDITDLDTSKAPVILPNGKTQARNTESYMQVLHAMANRVRVVNLSLGMDTSATGVAPRAYRTRLRVSALATERDTTVPAVAPDTTPRSFIDSLPTLTLLPNMIVKAQLLWVEFKQGVSQSARQAFVEQFGGHVIGGRSARRAGAEGVYLIHIPQAATGSDLVRAAFQANDNDVVAFADLLQLNRPDDASWTTVWAQAKERDTTVPAVAPDTTPRSFIDSLPTLTLLPNMVVKAQLLWVEFKQGVSQSARQAFVEQFGGNVIGGWQSQQFPGTEGVYLVHLPHATTGSALLRIVFLAREDAGITMASLYQLNRPDDASWTTVGAQAKELVSEVPPVAPVAFPRATVDSLPEIHEPNGISYKAQLLVVEFRSGTPQADRERVVHGLGAYVIGGWASRIGGEGAYLLRAPGLTTAMQLTRASLQLLDDPAVAMGGVYHTKVPDGVVPAVPPDTLSPDLFSRTNTVYDSTVGGPIQKDLLVL